MSCFQLFAQGCAEDVRVAPAAKSQLPRHLLASPSILTSNSASRADMRTSLPIATSAYKAR